MITPGGLRLSLATAVVALAISVLSAQPAKKAQAQRTTIPAETLAGLESHPNLTYARYGTRELQLDLYRPKERAQPLPAIVCIHGGGWFKGERSSMTQLAQALAARGFVTVTISYRLSGEAKFPAAIQDSKAAVRWLRANAATYGIDPASIGVTGLYAGGHLAALLTTSGGVNPLEGDGGNASQSSAVQAGLGMGAQSDLEAPHIRELSSKPTDPHYRTFLGAGLTEIPQTYALASPRHHLDRNDPPLAFMAGELDDPSTHADAMRRDLMKLGIGGGLTLIPQAPHAFLGQQRAFDLALNVCDSFFTTHLKHHGRPSVLGDVPGIFASNAHWQQLSGGHVGTEGPQWIVNQGEPTLHYAAHHDHLAYRWTERGGLSVWRDDSPEATSFRPDGRGGFYVVEQTNRRLTRWDANGRMTEVLADKFEGKKLNRPNDVIVKSDGTLWFTDPDFLFVQRPQDVKELAGQSVYRLDPATKALTAVARDFDKPNGIAFSPDEAWLYVTDSGTPSLYRWPVLAGGRLGPREVFATFTEKGLDGLAFDSAGRLWCATKDGIRVLDQTGKILGLIKTPGKPTAFAFAPAPSKWVCVTTREACWIASLR